MTDKAALACQGTGRSQDGDSRAGGEPSWRTSQRARLVAIMAVLMVIGVFSQSALINTYLIRDFERLEQSQVQASLRLVQLWLERIVRPIESLARELAVAPQDTPDAEAIRQRLHAAYQLDVGYDVAGVFGADDQLVFALAFDRQARAERPPTTLELHRLEQALRALRSGGTDTLSGWTAVPGGLFASAARTQSDQNGGLSVVIGRDIDARAMAALDDLSGTQVSTAAGTTPPAREPGQPLQACTPLSPALNATPQQLCLQLQDSFVARGQRSSNDLRLASLAGFVVLMLGTWWFLDRSLLRRLTRLTRKLDDTQSAGTESLERAMLADGERGDELGRMSQGMGRLLGQVRKAEADLRERERSFRVLAESSGVAIFVVRDGVLYSNPFASQLSGYAPEALRGRALVDLIDYDWRNAFEAALECGDARAMDGEELRGRRQDGSLYWARLHIARIEYQGSPAMLVTLVDVTERRHLEQVLADEKQNLQTILSSIHDGIVAVDHTGTVRFINPAAQRLTGIPPALANGSQLDEVVSLTDADSAEPLPGPLMRTLLQTSAANTLATVRTPQGQSRSVELSLWQQQSDAAEVLKGAVLVMRDVSDLRQLTAILAEQAAHDDLTGLINRREFARRLRLALQSTRTDLRRIALCYVDLDQFKLLNDTCGHHAGDLMLRDVADALRSGVREQDTLARLGGDEFGVLIEDCTPEAAVQTANSLRTKVGNVRFQWNGQNFGVDASVGIAMLDEVEGEVDEALSLADAACYMAKDLGRNRVHLYSPADVDLQRQLRHMRWATRLKDAVENSLFCLYAQHIVPVAQAAPDLNACEVLVRMRQADGRIVAPEEFLSAAERYQMMTRIDQWVVTATLAALHAEHELGRGTQPLLFVNLSGQSLGDEGFREFLLGALARYPHLAAQLVFEVTESAVISSLVRAKRLMQEVCRLGCRFALDDFGTGMSSFAYLKELRVDYLKIAGTFVQHIDNPLDAAVVRSFTEFARMMKVTVIAEAIENPSALRTLRSMNVDYGQGWHFDRPQPIEQVLRLSA